MTRHALTGWFAMSPIFLVAAAQAQSASQAPTTAGAPQSQPAVAPAKPEQSPQSPAQNSGTPAPQEDAAKLSLAKRYYTRGAALYTQGKYDAAWVEFNSAYQVTPLPDLLFNMARCEERMNRPGDAARHYRQFLEHVPDDADAKKIRARIPKLEEEEAAASSSAASGPSRRTPVYSIIAGSGTLLFAIIGAAALSSARVRYDDLSAICAPNCPESNVMSLQQTIQAGQAFISLAAIGAVGTAGLLVWELRRGRKER